MNTKVQTQLEDLSNEFNTAIRRNIRDGRYRDSFENSVKSLLDRYKSTVCNVLRVAQFGSMAENYFEGEMRNIESRIDREMNGIANETTDFLCSLNTRELTKNIETLEQRDLDNDSKKQEVKKHAMNKEQAVDDEKSTVNREAEEKSIRLEREIDRTLEETCNFVDNLARSYGSGDYRQSMMMLATADAIRNSLARFSNEKNPQLQEGYMQAIIAYKNNSLEAFKNVQQEYKGRVLNATGLELSKDDVFAVPDDIKKKVEEFGKNNSSVENKPKETKKEKDYEVLPSDIII